MCLNTLNCSTFKTSNKNTLYSNTILLRRGNDTMGMCSNKLNETKSRIDMGTLKHACELTNKRQKQIDEKKKNCTATTRHIIPNKT